MPSFTLGRLIILDPCLLRRAAEVLEPPGGSATTSTSSRSVPWTTRRSRSAGAALGGLWGNHAYEAAYVMTYLDDDGEQLTGNRSYQLHLRPTPPVGAFWSLTMYNVPNFFLVDNPIDRYSIGDRTPAWSTNRTGP